jgi:hypothetical protein
MRASKRSFPDQWHLTATPLQQAPEERFLVAIQVSLDPSGRFAPLRNLSGNPNFRRVWAEWLPTRGWRLETLLR